LFKEITLGLLYTNSAIPSLPKFLAKFLPYLNFYNLLYLTRTLNTNNIPNLDRILEAITDLES